uniref:Variable surface lipoprotein C n=1 Tax=Mycoplasmopsis agalactiae TaxID=2110 RepID=A1X5L8_MYCAA|nr:variable surface lipoprotein C precursor [Mycoplasmopsis agalactiae]
MKKSKFLLLGPVSSLAAIPFVAAKCGDTKEEDNKKPADTQGEGQSNPGGNQNPGTEGGGNNSSTTPGTTANKSKTDISKKLSAENLKDLAKKLKDEFNESPSYDNIQKALSLYFNEIKNSDFLVQGSSEKLEITIKGDNAKFQGTIILTKESNQPPGDSNTTSSTQKVDSKMIEEWKNKASRLIKELKETSEKLGKAEFDGIKLEKFKKENKDSEYLEELKDLKKETFPTLVNDFKNELETLIKDVEDLLNVVPKETLIAKELETLNEYIKDTSELVKEQLSVFEKVSTYKK